MDVVKIAPVDGLTAAAPIDVSSYLRPGTLRLSALPPLSLYIHVPWCIRKCPYCDFNSHEHADGVAAIPETEYLAALRADLESALALIWGRRIVSIFIGGGTPSLLSARAVDRLLSDVRALLPLAPDCEITLEANPGTFEADKFAAYRASGINRLSIGIQSFDDAKLNALGRVHDGAQARAAVDIAQRNFDNFNLDLMYALPAQTMHELQQDIEQALRIAPPHLSLYQLTLEPNTVYAKYPPVLPDEDLAAEMHEWIECRTADAGYQHYEVSAYARADKACRHNVNYWSFGDYLGIGAGAASKISFPHRIIRQTRLKQPDAYLRAAPGRAFIAESHEVSRAELPFEFMLNALRLSDGFPLRWFSERTGLPLSAIESSVAAAERRHLLLCELETIAPTALGRRFLTDLQSLFLPRNRTAPRGTT